MQTSEIVRKILVDVDNKIKEVNNTKKIVEDVKSKISNYVVHSESIEYNILFDYKKQIDMEINKINVLTDEINILKQEAIKIITGA
jgi:hypothetical protein